MSNIIEMAQSFNCLLLNSDILIPVSFFNDNIEKCTFLQQGDHQQKVYLSELTGVLLKNDICSKANVNSNNTKLWKVNVKKSEIKDKNVSTEEDIEKKLGGKEMELQELFEEYFQDELDHKNFKASNIHIIAIISATDSLEWSIDLSDTSTVVSNVDAILADFRELFKRCCCEKLKLPIFKPDKAHPYYNAIRDLQIPSNPKYKQRPLLLMNDLPTINGNDGLTDTTVLEDLSQIKEIMIVLGTSGSGKTRTLIELLCKKYGIYFTGLVKENPGSGDLRMMIDHIFPRLKESLPKNDLYATRYSKCLLFARIYTLNYILENYGKINPCNWAILQLCPTVFFKGDIFETITLEFRKVPEYFLDVEIRKLISNILAIVNQETLPVILDEAQELIDRFQNKFTSTTDKDKSRPLYSLVIRAFTISGICVIPSGTGLTMKSVLDIGSHTLKGATWNHEDLIVIKNEFGSTKMLRNFLSKFGFPFDDHQDIMWWFVGRVRFATTFVEEWLNNNYGIDELFAKFKGYYTDPDSNKSIMVKIVNRTNNDTIRQGIRNNLKEGESEVDILSLLERAVIKNWFDGLNSIIVEKESALELFEYGVALLHREKDSKLQIIISEPLVIDMGILWELLIPNAIIKLFQDEGVRDIFKKPLPYNDWKIYEPPNGSLSVLATRSTSDYTLPNFLENPVSPFFYPENVAGPDVVTVMCPVDSDKKYLVLIQAKFRLKNKGDVLLTTDPKKFYHTRPENKGVEAKLLKGKVYEISYDKVTKLIKKNYDGIFRIFISYPAEVTLKEEIEAKEMEVEEEEWVAIIDASNCNRIFEEKHIEMFKELKNPGKRNFDNGQNSSNKKPKALAEVNEAEVNEQHEK
ncbi:hypothetical protein GLOIN_2v1737241 [Rhizophagus irregularis DAOM 181602=DAOM 197198]|nr:hypothetical protein GLOIN_2v1737241 [Rhizophagus irregularis DAOM 181602=DAOM 197198]